MISAPPQTPWGTTHDEYSKKLLGMFLAGHPNHQLVFMRIWQINKEYLTSAFRDYYADSALNITRILDIAQDLKVSFLCCSPACAARKLIP